MKTKAHIELPHKKIETFCQSNHIKKLSLFGSVLNDDFTPESDVDVLVEFDPAHVPGFITLSGMELELSEILGRKADIRTAEDLSLFFRDKVVKSAEVQYAH